MESVITGQAPARELQSWKFRHEREATWRALEGLVTKIERKRVGSLSARELSRLPMLYRATLSSLMMYWNPDVEVSGLHELVGNALIMDGEKERELDLREEPLPDECLPKKEDPAPEEGAETTEGGEG